MNVALRLEWTVQRSLHLPVASLSNMPLDMFVISDPSTIPAMLGRATTYAYIWLFTTFQSTYHNCGYCSGARAQIQKHVAHLRNVTLLHNEVSFLEMVPLCFVNIFDPPALHAIT